MYAVRPIIRAELKYVAAMFEAARTNAMNPKHPDQAGWMRFWLGLVGIELGDKIEVPTASVAPPAATKRRVTRPSNKR
jgi:hypothetical protein